MLAKTLLILANAIFYYNYNVSIVIAKQIYEEMLNN